LRVAADLYVAAFLTPKTGGVPANHNAVKIPSTAHVWDALAGRTVYEPLVGRAQELASAARAFHWQLEFPDIMAGGGFDAVLGNPPWERIKLQEKEFFAPHEPEIAEAPNAAARGKLVAKLKAAPPGTRERRVYEEFEAAKRAAEVSSIFARVDGDEGGRFPLAGRGDVNTYALFAELFANIVSKRGRAGMIVPTGIATDATTATFFAALVSGRRLARLIDFENRDGIFPAVHRSYKFSLLTVGHEVKAPEFAFFLTDTEQLAEQERHFILSADDIARINPNTKTAPVLRSRADAELTAKIYARVPVLINEAKGAEGNPWKIAIHTRLWHMAEDAEWFRTSKQLLEAGFLRDGRDWVMPTELRSRDSVPQPTGETSLVQRADLHNIDRYVPLYEAKMIHQFDHRWGTYDNGDSRGLTNTEKADPAFEPAPRYWVPEREVTDRVAEQGWSYNWLMCWRDIARSTDERTVIFSIIPFSAVGHTAPLMFVGAELTQLPLLFANFNSIIFDYVARLKVGGTHLTYGYLKQFAALPPSAYAQADLNFIIPRVLELTFTSRSLTSFARDIGYDDPPFAWDEDRRAQLRAELDAWYARAYGLTRDELRYILDPGDVKGADYPSETFRVLKANDISRFGPEDNVCTGAGHVKAGMGTYRTARLVLQAWDRMKADSTTDPRTSR
jgi:hypothetical protein